MYIYMNHDESQVQRSLHTDNRKSYLLKRIEHSPMGMIKKEDNNMNATSGTSDCVELFYVLKVLRFLCNLHGKKKFPFSANILRKQKIV